MIKETKITASSSKRSPNLELKNSSTFVRPEADVDSHKQVSKKIFLETYG